MERRLDIAIFRALFASSARQARQFVLHGAVTVNGKKVPSPAQRGHFGGVGVADFLAVVLDDASQLSPQPRGHVPGRY
jgi:predicted rRNA methylase YqxC with S4 and FtsJ domains